MSNQLLDDLLAINVERVSVEDFNPDDSIEIWWKAKTRRPNQKERKEYRKSETHVSAATTTSCDMDDDSDSSDSTTSQDDMLDWDCWLDHCHDF